MRKLLILLSISFYTFYNSQIKLDILVHEKISTGKYLLRITVKNQTNDFYALPLDKTGFKAYYSSEYCASQESEYSYKYLSPTIMLKDNSKNQFIEASSKMMDLVENYKDEYSKNMGFSDKEKEELILKWKNKNSIQTISAAQKNYYLVNNLVLLRPNEEIDYNVELDMTGIPRLDIKGEYDYYFLDHNKYALSLDLCILENVYMDLTKRQKEKLKKYKLYGGTIKSNTFSFEAYK
ncbi:hypothetical protein [Chryseobacterium pennipullorum]|uniref:Uncharacterized protein n=1 Tax=Chryseobacterium pennipullorum TaxID=2258963 RepID=A0A3D9BAU5_9FLAO|nr:hypothetical protein [Chryseobacterium pennipullorum]REC50402.1 hypothetical protein DRF67_02420 [Chryseobacterium pennipullorum]